MRTPASDALATTTCAEDNAPRLVHQPPSASAGVPRCRPLVPIGSLPAHIDVQIRGGVAILGGPPVETFDSDILGYNEIGRLPMALRLLKGSAWLGSN